MLAAERGIDLRGELDSALMVPVDQLDRAIELIEELNLVVLGMEGLREDGAVVVPLIDYIADLGGIVGEWSERVRESTTDARAILQQWLGGPDLVDLVLDGLDE